MCEPTTLLAISAATALIGTGVSMYGSYTQGQQQKAYYNYQAAVAEDNAKIANANAAEERQSGIEEARLQRMKTLQSVGSQQTAMAANGIDITQGTALDIIEDTAAMGELDALQIQYNAEKKALAYEQEANNYTNQSNLDTIAGKNAYTSGIINTVSTGFNGIASATGNLATGLNGTSSKSSSVASKWKGFGS